MVKEAPFTSADNAIAFLGKQLHPRKALRNGHRPPARVWSRIALPGLALYSVFVIYPTLATLYYSLTNYKGIGGSFSFIGFANYRGVLESSLARNALRNTLEATVAIVIGSNLLGLVVALLLSRRSKLNYLLRLLWFLPAALPGIVAGYIWTFLYSPEGPIASLWHAVGLGSVPPAFLGSPREALWSIAVIVIWQSSGYSMVILLAGLQAVSSEVVDAARVDGANAMQRLRFVVMPLLRPSLAVSTILSIVHGMLLFEVVVATTDGGPGSATETLATQLYKQAFLFDNYGFGMAMGVLMALLILIVVGGVLFVVNRREVER